MCTSGLDMAKEQQAAAVRIAERTLVLLPGRANLRFGIVPAVSREVRLFTLFLIDLDRELMGGGESVYRAIWSEGPPLET